MEINDEILEILSEVKIQKDDGICYLLSLFYRVRNMQGGSLL